MYSRKLGKRTLTFGHEGILYRKSFVMYDHQTATLWVHTTGRAAKGALRGKQLTFLPSTITTWDEWKTIHPKTTVLPGRMNRGFMGTFGVSKRRFSSYGLSVGFGPNAKLYPYSEIKKSTVINDEFDGMPLAIVLDPATTTAIAFEASLHNKKLTMKPAGTDPDRGALMKDIQTGSLWVLTEGVSIKGKHKGKRLTQAIGTPWLMKAWKGFYPAGEIYGD